MTEPANIPSLYLDTSDLSYLVRGRGPGGSERLRAQAQRLRGLLEDERVRLFISFVHLAEMALDDETREAARVWLREVGPIWCFLSAPEDIFRAELLGEPFTGQVRVLTLGDLKGIKVPTRFGLDVPGASVARWIKAASRRAAWGDRVVRDADRRARADGRRKGGTSALSKVLVGDLASMPGWARPLARACRRMTSTVLRRLGNGLSLEQVVRQQKLTKHGLAWVSSLIEPARWPAPSFVAASSAAQAPACALRAAIERREARDLSRKPASSTHYDVRHVAFAAYCDVATLDGTNFDATKTIRTALTRPTIFRTGRLDEVLEHLDPGR